MTPSVVESARTDLVTAGSVLAQAGLVSAFGHVSVRTEPGRLLITPPQPLGRLSVGGDFTDLAVEASELPPAVPKEAWIHLAIARARPDVGAICRAQPETATALASTDTAILPLHGQGAFLGARVPVFDDAVLVRDADRAARLADRLGPSPALILRGNGAVTAGSTVGEAVALMWVLEASARMNATAAAAGTPTPLTEQEQSAWRAVAPELLTRIWRHLGAGAQSTNNSNNKSLEEQ